MILDLLMSATRETQETALLRRKVKIVTTERKENLPYCGKQRVGEFEVNRPVETKH